MSTFVRAAILSAMTIVAFPGPALACTCAMRPATVAFHEVDLVFTGRAEVTRLGPGAQRARFRVEEHFRGPAARVVEIVARGIGGSCAYAFLEGTRYLVFARRARDGTWSAFFCDPSAPVDQAGEDLTYVRRMAAAGRRR
jgi:hypothetical protein